MVNVEAPGVSPAPPVVLIVESDRDTRELYETIFKLEGFSVNAVDGADAISRATDVPPDVIVTDVGLPGGCDGVFIAKAVHALPHSVDVPVIAVTGRNRTDISPDAEFCAVLQKPVLPSELIDATHARHWSYAQTVRAAEGGAFVVGFMGRYEDELVKRDGRWYIQSRKLVSFVR